MRPETSGRAPLKPTDRSPAETSACSADLDESGGSAPEVEAIRYFVPGPAYVRTSIREAMLEPIVAHRSPSFRRVYQRMGERLCRVFRTSRPVPWATGSATLVMEMAIRSTVGERVLHLTGGAFAERWQAITRSCGLEADRVEVPWGRAMSPDAVRAALRRRRYDAVAVTHCETSTGVLHPVEEIARAVREESDALILVDAVSSLGGVPVETESWGLDVVVTGSQKALAAPPGVVPFTASERTEDRVAGVKDRGFFTDLQRYLDYQRDGGPITTPALPVAFALDRQLGVIEEEGLAARWERHRRLASRTSSWAATAGCRFASEAGFRSPTVSCLEPPPGIEAPALVQAMAERGFVLGSGYGRLKASTFRIGHMGEVQDSDLEALLEGLDDALADLRTDPHPK